MKRSASRILTTHGGRVPNPANYHEFQAANNPKALELADKRDEAYKEIMPKPVR